MRKAAVTWLLLTLAACNRAAPPAQVAAVPAAPVARPNLMDLAQGACVVSRTAELDLEHSALRLIDDANSTGWVTPAEDPAQSVVLSLPARARIDRVGIVSTRVGASARDLQIDFSLDGVGFNGGVMLKAKQVEGPQDLPVAPAVEAQYVRLTTLNGHGPHVLIRSLVVNGAFLAQPTAGAIDGCWSVNGQPATFHSDHAAATGYGGPNGMTLDGGSDGRFYRFAWTRDKQYGLAALSVTPDGKHLGAIVWHEQAIDFDQFYAEDWLGERGACSSTPKEGDVFSTYLERFGYFPLYALRFSDDGTLDDEASRPALARVAQFVAANPHLQLRFVAHELTHANARENLAVAQRKIATLRDALSRRGFPLSKIGFIALGEEHPRREGTNALIRAMYSSVDLEVRR
ncbi:MAG TPA: discoidin domain-containing protein [Thermoanaerobaculia bacterium]